MLLNVCHYGLSQQIKSDSVKKLLQKVSKIFNEHTVSLLLKFLQF